MPQTLPNIDFRLICSHGGKQTDGFEELTVQLFRGETHGKGELYRIEGSGGAGGVEAYRVAQDGKIFGFQSKYFDVLGASQWRQINESVITTLKNHPTLRYYLVSTPLNRTPTQATKWETLKKEWMAHARTLGITHHIEFVWWGLSELTGLLSKPIYRNQLVYWFGLPDFSTAWVDGINRSNIQLLGKRYSPKQNVQTNSSIRLEAFTWGEGGRKKIISAFLSVAEKWRELDRRSVAESKLTADAKALARSFRRLTGDVLAFRWPQQGYPKIRPISEICRTAAETCQNLEWKLRELNIAEKERRSAKKRKSEPYQSGPYETLIRYWLRGGKITGGPTHTITREIPYR